MFEQQRPREVGVGRVVLSEEDVCRQRGLRGDDVQRALAGESPEPDIRPVMQDAAELVRDAAWYVHLGVTQFHAVGGIHGDVRSEFPAERGVAVSIRLQRRAARAVHNRKLPVAREELGTPDETVVGVLVIDCDGHAMHIDRRTAGAPDGFRRRSRLPARPGATYLPKASPRCQPM